MTFVRFCRSDWVDIHRESLNCFARRSLSILKFHTSTEMKNLLRKETKEKFLITCLANKGQVSNWRKYSRSNLNVLLYFLRRWISDLVSLFERGPWLTDVMRCTKTSRSGEWQTRYDTEKVISEIRIRYTLNSCTLPILTATYFYASVVWFVYTFICFTVSYFCSSIQFWWNRRDLASKLCRENSSVSTCWGYKRHVSKPRWKIECQIKSGLSCSFSCKQQKQTKKQWIPLCLNPRSQSISKVPLPSSQA